MSSNKSTTFLDTDLIILQVILVGCGSSTITLKAILETGVAVHEHLFVYDELNGGLSRLIRAKLITVNGDRIAPTAASLEMSRFLESGDQSLEEQLTGIADLLEGTTVPVADSSSGPQTPAVSEELYSSLLD